MSVVRLEPRVRVDTPGYATLTVARRPDGLIQLSSSMILSTCVVAEDLLAALSIVAGWSSTPTEGQDA